jgi:hypothetical protein
MEARTSLLALIGGIAAVISVSRELLASHPVAREWEP